MSYFKGYKIRLYPTKEQEQIFLKHIGCCRFIWNHMLDVQIDNYKNCGKFIGAFLMSNMITRIKRDGEHDWLYEVSSASLQNECRDLEFALKMMRKAKNGFPKFKSKKRDKNLFQYHQARTLFISKKNLFKSQKLVR